MQSYQVYLQHVSSVHSPQFHSSDENNVRTSTIVVKAPETATCRTLCLLLRKKLELTYPEFFSRSNLLDEQQPTCSFEDSLVLVLTSASRLVHFNNHEYGIPHDITSPTSNESTEYATITTEPMHLVRALKMIECPAQIQRSMIQRFLKKASTEEKQDDTLPFTLDIRWYFVPSSSLYPQPGAITPLFPNFIDLDGYCTGELSDDDLNDGKEALTLTSPQLGFVTTVDNKLHKHRKKTASLCSAIASHQNDCITGFLFKQSKSDPFVWRRVCCYITDDAFWWVHRTKPWSDSPPTSHHIGKIGYVTLSGATVLESNNPRIPHMFEISSAEGLVFTFRTEKRSTAMKWIEQLSSRIDSCFCNDWMAMADLIIADETMVRSLKKKI